MIDLSDRVADIASCRARGCVRTRMDHTRHVFEDDDGQDIVVDAWIVTHQTAERWAGIPVPTELVEDAPAFAGILPSIVDEAHEIMDRLGERSG